MAEAQAMTAQPTGKLTAALVLGIVGGCFGILAGLLAMVVGGVGTAFEAEGSGTVTGLGFAAIFIAVVGIVGGALAKSKPVAAAILQAIACVAGFIAVSAFWLISGPLLLGGAILAFLGRPRANRHAVSSASS